MHVLRTVAGMARDVREFWAFFRLLLAESAKASATPPPAPPTDRQRSKALDGERSPFHQ